MTYTPAAVIQRYLEIRQQKKEFEASVKARTAEFDAMLEAMETFCLQTMQERGETQIKTDFGTAYKSPQLRVTMVDRASLIDHVKKTGNYDFFTNHVNKDAVKLYRETHKDNPPGVGAEEFVQVNIRKA